MLGRIGGLFLLCLVALTQQIGEASDSLNHAQNSGFEAVYGISDEN
jgi:hypothetical protein